MSKFVVVKESKNERSNCGVIALQYAHNLTYDIAREYAVKYFNYKEGKGMPFNRALYWGFLRNESLSASEIPSDELKYPGSPRYIKNKNPEKKNIVPVTLIKFLEKFPKNKYLVEIRGHLFVVNDGKVIGTGYEGNRQKIEGAWLIQ